MSKELATSGTDHEHQMAAEFGKSAGQYRVTGLDGHTNLPARNNWITLPQKLF